MCIFNIDKEKKMENTSNVNKIGWIIAFLVSSAGLAITFYIAYIMLKPTQLIEFYKFMAVIMVSIFVMDFLYFKFKKK
jgi:NADH:ubiquinone oxidoreductase subunit 5 (subunit L)/multisubunit Na+/H+ antiporter MnhA subunit